MKNRTPLVLMEQMIMVLVFALAAALCIGIFVQSGNTAKETKFRDDAVVLAQNGTEVIKACGGDLEDTARVLKGTCTEKEVVVQSEGYTMVITPVESDTPGLAQAEICVSMDGILIFTLRTGWQEMEP